MSTRFVPTGCLDSRDRSLGVLEAFPFQSSHPSRLCLLDAQCAGQYGLVDHRQDLMTGRQMSIEIPAQDSRTRRAFQHRLEKNAPLGNPIPARINRADQCPSDRQRPSLATPHCLDFCPYLSPKAE
jgi:hypothetical protein